MPLVGYGCAGRIGRKPLVACVPAARSAMADAASGGGASSSSNWLYDAYCTYTTLQVVKVKSFALPLCTTACRR